MPKFFYSLLFPRIAGTAGPEQLFLLFTLYPLLFPYWNAIVGNGGQESACGWCNDKWGVSWQITPLVLTQAVTDPDPDPAAAKRAFDAMMRMKKIDIAAIEAARRG